jgi:hypothetical protein
MPTLSQAAIVVALFAVSTESIDAQEKKPPPPTVQHDAGSLSVRQHRPSWAYAARVGRSSSTGIQVTF